MIDIELKKSLIPVALVCALYKHTEDSNSLAKHLIAQHQELVTM
jgi:hypothetical protein